MTNDNDNDDEEEEIVTKRLKLLFSGTCQYKLIKELKPNEVI